MKRNTKIIIAGVGIAVIAGVGYVILSKNGTIIGRTGSVNDNNYNATVSKGNDVVWFSRSGCEYCELLKGEIDAIQGDYAFKGINFLNYNTDVNTAIATQMGISGLPMVYFYKDGQLVNTLTGYQSRTVLQDQIKQIYGV